MSDSTFNPWPHMPGVKEAQKILDEFHDVVGSKKDIHPRKSVLDEARDVIYGDREQTYGDPGKNLRIIADYWNTYLVGKGFDFLEGLDYDDVCNMMVLVKLARLGNTPGHHDSLVDICGYTALQERVKNANQQAQTCADTPTQRP